VVKSRRWLSPSKEANALYFGGRDLGVTVVIIAQEVKEEVFKNRVT